MLGNNTTVSPQKASGHLSNSSKGKVQTHNNINRQNQSTTGKLIHYYFNSRNYFLKKVDTLATVGYGIADWSGITPWLGNTDGLAFNACMDITTGSGITAGSVITACLDITACTGNTT
jgi:hypothetical protein